MNSNTFNSHDGLCYSYCHSHFKEKQIETTERLTNLPQATELVRAGIQAQVFRLQASPRDLNDAVNSPL